MGYTKGEWKVISAEFTDKGVAYEVVMPEQEICAANAKLISQAPKLYEALRKVMNDYPLAHYTGNNHPCTHCTALKALAEVEKY